MYSTDPTHLEAIKRAALSRFIELAKEEERRGIMLEEISHALEVVKDHVDHSETEKLSHLVDRLDRIKNAVHKGNYNMLNNPDLLLNQQFMMSLNMVFNQCQTVKY